MKRTTGQKFAVGTEFIVTRARPSYGLKVGDIVTMKMDDGSTAPRFLLPRGEGSLYLDLDWMSLYLDSAPHVDDVYASLSDGQRTHMLNKLAKNGYDNRTQATRNRHDAARKAKLIPPVKTYCRGDQVVISGKTYIIACIGHGKQVALVNMKTGMTRNGADEVARVDQITKKELDAIS